MYARTLSLLSYLFIICVIDLSAQKYLVSGCGYDKISIVDRSGNIFWSYDVPGSDCNDAEITDKGNVLLAYKYGAMLVDIQKNVLWNFKVDYPNEEMYTATQLTNGNFLLACCGLPARIIEIDHECNVINEVVYDTGIKDIHSQFRQIIKTDTGTYIIPIMGNGTVREITSDGKILRELYVGGTPFQTTILNNGNWLVSCGDGHKIVEISPKDGSIKRTIDNNNLYGCKLKFVAECSVMENGNILVANWDGHDVNGDKSPAIIEIDTDNNIVWSLYSSNHLYRISTLSIIKTIK